MRKLFAAVLAGSTFLALGMGEARADDNATATVIAERRALKPGNGLYVVDTTIDVRIGRGGLNGWAPETLEFDLWGKSDSANAIVVKWKDGAKVVSTTECQAPDIDEAKDRFTGHYNDQAKVTCDVKGHDVSIAHTGTFEAEIFLRVAGKPEQLLRKVAFAVGSVKENDTAGARTEWFVDHDYKLAEVVGYWDWDAKSLHVRAYTKQASALTTEGKLRCTVNGAPFGSDGVVQPGGGMGLEVRGTKSMAWVQLEGVMWTPRSSGKWMPGKYECQMIVAAKVMRTIRFTLNDKLGFGTSSEQQGAGAIASRTTFLPDFDIPAGIDQPFSRTAFANLAMSGRTWKTVPNAIASASNVTIPSAPVAANSSAAPPKKAKGGGKAKPKTAKRK